MIFHVFGPYFAGASYCKYLCFGRPSNKSKQYSFSDWCYLFRFFLVILYVLFEKVFKIKMVGIGNKDHLSSTWSITWHDLVRFVWYILPSCLRICLFLTASSHSSLQRILKLPSLCSLTWYQQTWRSSRSVTMTCLLRYGPGVPGLFSTWNYMPSKSCFLSFN